MLEQFADARVFAIDDNKTNLELLQALLTRAGLRKLYTSNDPIDSLRGRADRQRRFVAGISW